jgi:Flp pilus assembly protein TadD
LLQGNYKEAIAAYDAAIKANPQYVDALNNMAQLHVESKQYKVAGQVLLRAIQLKVANERTLMLLARIYDASGADKKLTENVRQEWVKLVGGTAEGKARVAFAYLQLGMPVHARALLDSIRAETPDWKGLDLLEGRVCTAESKWKEAITALERAALKEPTGVIVRNDLVNALLKSGDAKGAVMAAETGTRLAADNAQSWFLLGASKKAAGDPSGAETAYRQAVVFDAGHAPALMNLAIIEASRNQAKAAVQYLEAALRADPYNPDIIYNLGRILVVSRIDYPRGIRLLGFAAQGQGESATLAKAFVNRLYEGVSASDKPENVNK